MQLQITINPPANLPREYWPEWAAFCRADEDNLAACIAAGRHDVGTSVADFANWVDCMEIGHGAWYDSLQSNGFPMTYGMDFYNLLWSPWGSQFKFGRCGTKANRSFTIICKHCKHRLFLDLGTWSGHANAIYEADQKLRNFVLLNERVAAQAPQVLQGAVQMLPTAN